MCRFEGGNDFQYRGYIHHRWIYQVIDDAMWAWPKLNLIESSLFDKIANFDDNMKDLSFRWRDNFNLKIINDGYMGPNVWSVEQYFINGIIHNKIY